MSSTNQLYTSRRFAITSALADKIKEIDGRGVYYNSIAEVSPYLKFMDEIVQHPAVHLNAGSESREYLAGGVKNRFLNVTLRLYVDQENSVEALDELIQDVELVLEDNSQLAYLDRNGNTQCTQQTTIISIDTDEGLLDPLGAAEILIEVRY
jgi:hypothetical protein